MTRRRGGWGRQMKLPLHFSCISCSNWMIEHKNLSGFFPFHDSSLQSFLSLPLFSFKNDEATISSCQLAFYFTLLYDMHVVCQFWQPESYFWEQHDLVIAVLVHEILYTNSCITNSYSGRGIFSTIRTLLREAWVIQLNPLMFQVC